MPGDGTEQRKLAAIMFKDMVGYSALAQRNEALALQLLEEHRKLLRDLFPKHQGTEIKTTGDGFLIEFASALAAVRCAIEIQRSLATRNVASTADRQLQVRIGIHVGDVVHHEGDVLGDGVNIASRIEPLAGPGGICISLDVERQIRNAIETSLVKLGPTELKNIQLPMELFRVVLPWEKRAKGESRRQKAEVNTIGRWALTRRLGWGATMVLFAVAIGWWFVIRQRQATTTSPVPVEGSASKPLVVPGRIESLLVKPFDNYSRDPDQDFFVDGMTDVLCAELGGISGLKKVISRTTAMQFKGSKKTIPEIGREVSVDAVVEGSVQRAGSQVLVTVQLIEATTDRHLWATNYERDVTNSLRLQRELARTIADEIKIKLTPQEQMHLASARPVSPQALEAYLKGRFFWNKRTGEALKTAIMHFQQAIRIDTNFAPAYAGMGDSYALLPLYSAGYPRESAANARRALARALELDNALGEAHTALCFVKLNDLDLASAEREMTQALALSPNSATAHQRAGLYYLARGQFPEAMAQRKRAEELDPLSLIAKVDVADVFYYMGQYDRAIEQYRKALELDPNYARAHWMLGNALTEQGKYQEAIAEFRQALNLSGNSGNIQATLGRAYALAGKREEAEGVLAMLKETSKNTYVGLYFLAGIHTALGQKDEVFALLERAHQERYGLVLLKIDPPFKSLRSDPRFTDLLKRMGLDK